MNKNKNISHKRTSKRARRARRDFVTEQTSEARAWRREQQARMEASAWSVGYYDEWGRYEHLGIFGYDDAMLMWRDNRVVAWSLDLGVITPFISDETLVS